MNILAPPRRSINWAVGLALSLISSLAACAPGNPPPATTSADAEPPAEGQQRYIVSVAAGDGTDVQVKNIDAVVNALKSAGAEQVDHLKGQRTIIVTCTPSAIEKAVSTGLVDSVQTDAVRKPYGGISK